MVPQSTANFFLDEAKIVVSTTEEHSAVSASHDSEFGASTPESIRVLEAAESYHSGSEQFPRYNANHFSVSSPSGTDIGGALYASSNALGQSGKCAFGGHVLAGS